MAQTRALGDALNGRHFDPYGLKLAARSVARFMPLLPVNVLRWGAEIALGSFGVPASDAARVDAEEMCRWVTGLYPDRDWDTVLLGAPSGGVSHIGSILNAPFLTTHFLVCFRHVRHPDDIYSTLTVGRRISVEIARRNPLLHVVNHYDPLHDRPALVFINHVRPKLTGITETYDRFLRSRLRPGGALVLINCTYPWLQYRVRRRVSFQVGGLGGVPAEEFLNGSDRISAYRAAQGAVGRGGWRLRGDRYPLERMPESEWGLMPEFAEEAREYAAARGLRLVELTADHPEKFSELAFHLHLEASKRDGEEPRYVFADCFNQLDPITNLRSRVLPLWLPYYCDHTFEFARRMLGAIPDDAEILLTLHPSFAEPFDMIPLPDWQRLFTRDQPPRLIGIDPDRFPNDISYALDFTPQLRRFCEVHPDPVRARLNADDLIVVAKRIGITVSDSCIS